MERRSWVATVYEHKKSNAKKKKIQDSGKIGRSKTDKGDGERSLMQREGEGESIPNPED